MPVSVLELDRRSLNCLYGENIFIMSELIGCKKRTLLSIPNFGRRSMDKIEDRLEYLGLYIGMRNNLTEDENDIAFRGIKTLLGCSDLKKIVGLEFYENI